MVSFQTGAVRERSLLAIALAVAVAGFCFQLGLQHAMRVHAIGGLYFQEWSSEHMIQTVSIQDLRAAPLRSLFNLHIQGPVFDAIRALLAQMWPRSGLPDLVRHVDRSLYVIWAALYGVLGGLVFLWLSRATRRPAFAVVAAAIFLLHPASIYYATLLETTLLSSVLILWMYYSLSRLRENPNGSLVSLGFSALGLFFTRSIFQWPAMVMFAVCLVLLGVPRRRAAWFLVVCGGIAGLYVGKQYAQFGVLSTSSLSGLNLTHSVGLGDDAYFRYLQDPRVGADLPPALPAVLTRRTKLDGTPNLNHISYLRVNQQLLEVYRERLRAMPLPSLVRNYLQTVHIYFQPSSRFTPHVIVDRLAWREIYDRAFSYPAFPLLIAAAAAAWMVSKRRRHGALRIDAADLALLAPALYVGAISIFADRGENMRFKFFLEPVLFVFIAAQGYALGSLARRRRAGLPR
ncbi:MAG TPA: hypothetical protein VLN08_14465 [Vicinamibacterales bacterium]|nr:hypothetical protein [Vicinamibacterales bacterium]